MHWVAHGQTAAEVVYSRIDAAKSFLGLTNFKGTQATQQKTVVAKNYLNEQELNVIEGRYFLRKHIQSIISS